jgi:hypothetical protein
LTAYDVRGSGAGAVAQLGRKKIGAPVPDPVAVAWLRWALVYGVLSARLPLSDDNSPRGTADNALVWGHGVKDPSFTAIYEGGLFTTLRGVSLRTGSVGKIARPEHLVIPSNFPDLDEERMTAFYEEFEKGLILGRRLRRALEWLSFAWTNTRSITPDVRIVALRTAFEALLGTRKNSGTKALRARLSPLLAPRAPKTRRKYADDWGKPQDEELTDIAWWFQTFTMVRNEIVHGDTVQRRSRSFGPDDESHVILASEHLLEALLRMLVKKGGHSKELLDDPLHRKAVRIFSAHLSKP